MKDAKAYVEPSHGHGMGCNLSANVVSIVDAMPDAACIVAGGRIRHLNPAGAALLGHESAADVIGRPMSVLLDGAASPLADGRWRPGGLRRANGAVVTAEIRAAALDEPPGAVLLIARDRAELESMGRAVAAARDEAKRSAATMRQFLANMTHELRTPLNAIIGFSEIMAGRFFGPLDDRYAAYARDILASGRHLLDIIEDILDLSKIEAGEMRLDEEQVFLDEIATACLRLVRDRARAGDVALSLDAAGDYPPIMGDSGKLKQVLLNLVSNAVKFTPPAGSVVVSARRDQADGALVLTVTDTGIGMTETEAAQATKPFKQVRAAVNGTEKGTGLGLSISSAIVEMHGGSLTIRSRPGEGTTVAVRLPPDRIVRVAG